LIERRQARKKTTDIGQINWKKDKITHLHPKPTKKACNSQVTGSFSHHEY
jgi:hypothetical protein